MKKCGQCCRLIPLTNTQKKVEGGIVVTEHVVLKNVKLALKLAMESPMNAGLPKVTIDAGHLKWLIEQAEIAQKITNAEQKESIKVEERKEN